MDYSISKSKLLAVMKLRGYATYEDVSAAGKQRGIRMSTRNIFKLAAGANYTRHTLETLCKLLDCTPGDLVETWHTRSNGHTHVSPQSEKKLEAIAA